MDKKNCGSPGGEQRRGVIVGPLWGGWFMAYLGMILSYFSCVGYFATVDGQTNIF